MRKLHLKTKLKSFFINAVKPRSGAEYAEVFSRGLKEEDKTAQAVPRKPWLYLRVLALGFIAFSLAVSIYCLFNAKMDYAIAVFFGGLFCNVTLVVFFFELYPKRDLSLVLLSLLTVLGGLLASGIASLGYEFIFDANSGNAWLDCLFVGFWEEFSKALIAIPAILLLKKKEPFACFLIGIAVGTGYSLFEDLGYIYAYSYRADSVADTWLVLMSVGRGLSCVCSHAPWTAIICWAFAKFKKPFINFRFYGFFIASAVLHFLADVPFFDDDVAFLTGLNWGWAIEIFVVVAIFIIMYFTLRNSTRALIPQEGAPSSDGGVAESGTLGVVLVLDKRANLSFVANLTVTLCAVASCVLLLIVCALPCYTQAIYQDMTIEEYVDYRQEGLPLKSDWGRYVKDYEKGNYASLYDENGILGIAVQKVSEDGYDYYYQYVFDENGEAELYSIGVKVEAELIFNSVVEVYDWGYSTVTPDNLIGVYYPEELIIPEEEIPENGFHEDEELLFSFNYFSVRGASIIYDRENGTVSVYMGRDDIDNDIAYIVLLSVAGAITISGATAFITLKIKSRRIKNEE